MTFFLQVYPAERAEAPHVGQRDASRAVTGDPEGRPDCSHALHVYRLLRHQEHQRLRLPEIVFINFQYEPE